MNVIVIHIYMRIFRISVWVYLSSVLYHSQDLAAFCISSQPDMAPSFAAVNHSGESQL